MKADSQGGAEDITGEDAIGLMDVVEFLSIWWKLIVFMGLAAAIAAWLLVARIPPLYQAQTIILMAKVHDFAVTSNFVARSSNVLVGVEPPSILADRLSFPTTFTNDVVDGCKFSAAKELLNNLDVISVNDKNSTLRIAVRHYSPQMAAVCVDLVFRMIEKQQAELLTIAIEKSQARLGEGRDLLSGQEARMLVPVYAEEDPVYPKKRQFLIAWTTGGLLLGLLMGLAWTLVRWIRQKSLVGSSTAV